MRKNLLPQKIAKIAKMGKVLENLKTNRSARPVRSLKVNNCRRIGYNYKTTQGTK
jgi:hypothetical protein